MRTGSGYEACGNSLRSPFRRYFPPKEKALGLDILDHECIQSLEFTPINDDPCKAQRPVGTADVAEGSEATRN